ncbi:Peroxin-3-domain-containing protein [Crepidotus variabilis]|uniref:Peroxin-3-domain-containing protein n=1 Tax=Crepidotus variabilis TaxID=179855 RepID=A0A9P6ELC5_9AGAR|nr:Peroxin-3-domain-containing protein [Crepidotus variabilis]
MFKKAVTVAGGLYVARQYFRERLEEVKEKLEVEKEAKQTLKKRFHQSQEDASWTVLALLPTLSEQILESMDVETLTNELQSRSKSRSTVGPSGLVSSVQPQIQTGAPQRSRPTSGVSSGIEVVNRETSDESTTSDVRLSSSFVSASGSVSQSWVDSPAASGSRNSPAPPASVTSSTAESLEDVGQTDVHSGRQSLAASFISTVTDASTSSVATDMTDTRSKAQLWNEVKMLTFTRTLTTLYSTTLLCLFTNLQLSFLARSKYVSAVLQQEHEDRMRERLEAELTPANLIFGSLGFGSSAGSSLEKLLSGGALLEDEDEDGTSDRGALWNAEGINVESETKYLTLTWWLLHVGWKDVGERVKRAVEETFDGVSLKTKLAAIDLHRLISDVRRRVEHEITFEGRERRTTFLSSVMPPTPETLQHVMVSAGYPSTSLHPLYPTDTIESSQSLDSSQLSYNFVDSPALAVSTSKHFDSQGGVNYQGPPLPLAQPLFAEPFASLLNETRDVLASPNFARVLEVALDKATEVLFDSLEKNVFRPAPGDTEEVRIRLAGLLPGLAKWSQLALNGIPNELVDNILSLREVSCLSAIVFAQFDEQFHSLE